MYNVYTNNKFKKFADIDCALNFARGEVYIDIGNQEAKAKLIEKGYIDFLYGFHHVLIELERINA